MTDKFTDTITAVEDSSSTEGVYANSEKADAEGAHMHAQRGDSSDEVDPIKLVKDPTLSEIRWYYRRTFAKVLVDKPIDDAFKNDFEFTSDNATEARNILEEPEFGGEGKGYIGAYRLAEKKARRDGFALVFVGTKEAGSDGIHQSPVDQDVDVDEITHLKVLTLDDLATTAPHEQIQDGTGLEEDQYRVRQTGIVINTDINSPDYRTPVGYVLDGADRGQFIHADRVQHLTWNPEVDGPYKGQSIRRWDDRNTTLGQYEGDSVLIPTYDLMKGIVKGNWAIMQALFRNASHVYSTKLPPDADKEDFGNAVKATRNINAKSAFVWPSTEYEFEQHESGNQMEPEEHYGVIFDQVCAGQEMTKSVLFGTQSGTVSGSETDIKNYFNKVERYRSNRAEGKIIEYLTMVKSMKDSRTSRDYEYEADIEWGPMFKVDEDTRIQMMQNEANALTTLIGKYALTPDEAREILNEDFTQIDLSGLTENQMDVLDRINLTSSGQGPSALQSEEEYTNAPQSTGAASQGGQSGGMQQGQTTASENPAGADSASQGDTDATASGADGAESKGTESLTDELERLAALRDSGLLTDDEFSAAKAEILDGD